MKLNMLLFLGLVLFYSCCSIYEANGYEYDCIHTAGNGKFYDLSPLSDCFNTGYSVSSNDGTFVLNVCNTVKGCNNAAVCQDGQYNCGNAGSAHFSDIGSGEGVVLTYPGGDSCPNNAQRQTILTFLCDHTATQPVLTFLSESPTCTYRISVNSSAACPKPVAPQEESCVVNVFLVPHTHDDVGWLLTIQGYYETQVKNILDTTVKALLDNPERSFIYVEQAYFTLWWYDSQTTDAQRDAVKQFVKQGRWEFVIGAWVMPDEACTTYGGVIDQMTLGHQFLLNTFGVTPTKGWQIDPFGASSVTSFLEKLSGFDAHIIDRVTNKGLYQDSKSLQFNWKPIPSLGDRGAVFSEIMGGGGYCDWISEFDFSNNPVNPSNVATWGKKFVDMANGRSAWYKTPNILAEWGCDFAFQNAAPEFESMDLLIGWLQANAQTNRVNVKYSVLSDYFASVWSDAKEQNIQFPTDNGDYFPYFTGCWWTGYYTSRVELKGLVRRGEATSHLAEPMYALGRLFLPFSLNSTFAALDQLRVANGYAQHHDGVTGTSVPEVVIMYQNYLLDGISAANNVLSQIINLLIKKASNSPTPNLVAGTDALLKIGSGQTVVLVLFNSLGWTRSDVLVLPVNRASFVVYDSNMNKITSQVTPAVGGNITSLYHLSFAVKLSGFSYSTVYVTSSSSDTEQPIRPTEISVVNADVVVQNNFLALNFSQTTKRLSSVTNKKSGITVAVDQNLLYYTSMNSGAYCFGPAGEAKPIIQTPTISIVNGPVSSEITQTFGTYAKQTIRFYNDGGNEDVENLIDIAFDIGPLPSHVEVISHFSTSINSAGEISTDDNGYLVMKRAYQYINGIAGNYYPSIYSSYINDVSSQLTVISERSHGVSSQLDGDFEVMLHRNPDMGDGFGPGLTDTTEVYPSLRVLVDSPLNSLKTSKKHSYLVNFPISVFSTASSAATWSNYYTASSSLLGADLPPNVHLLSFNVIDQTNAVLRLTHLYGVDEDPVLSQAVTLDLSKLFAGFTVHKISETTLSANKVLNVLTSPIITLVPKDIRTFVMALTK